MLILILILTNVLFINIFFLSDNIFYSNINTDINISWTSLSQFYDVQSPSNRTIYSVFGGHILSNTDMNKYKINSKGIEQIDISVLNVSRNDGGIYQSTSSNVDECCLLIITGLYIVFYFSIIIKTIMHVKERVLWFE